MTTLSSYSPVQQHALTRYGRLKMLQRDVLPQLDQSDFRVKLTLKALYATYQELHELGLEKEARLLREPGPFAPPPDEIPSA
jgi:hypothetical protein